MIIDRTLGYARRLAWGCIHLPRTLELAAERDGQRFHMRISFRSTLPLHDLPEFARDLHGVVRYARWIDLLIASSVSRINVHVWQALAGVLEELDASLRSETHADRAAPPPKATDELDEALSRAAEALSGWFGGRYDVEPSR